MRLHCCLVLSLLSGISLLADEVTTKVDKPAFQFADIEYFHRGTEADLHEYTPKGQEDLKRWQDMVSVNVYPMAKDGEALATTANAVLQNYKNFGAKIIRTTSVPRTEKQPAEHLIVVLFAQPEFIEVAFARLRMHEGIGTSVVYSHRVYGDKKIDEVSEWLKASGQTTEKALMKWDATPSLETLTANKKKPKTE